MEMGIEFRKVEAVGPRLGAANAPECASTVIYALPGSGLEPSMADDLDLPVDDVFARTVAVPKKVAIIVDKLLDQRSNCGAAARELRVSPALIMKIQDAEIDRGLRRQALYAAYRLPILPERHKAIVVSGTAAGDAIADLASDILCARGAQEIIVIAAPRARSASAYASQAPFVA
jgi:predicted phosphoribosyltransferase